MKHRSAFSPRSLPLALLALAGCVDLPTSPPAQPDGGRLVANRHDLQQVSGTVRGAGPTSDLAPLDYPIWIYWVGGKRWMAGKHPEIAKGIVRAAREWAALLWPTTTEAYSEAVRCPVESYGDVWFDDGTPAGLILVVSVFEAEPNVGARAGECSPEGPRYNPSTETTPAGLVEFNANASWSLVGETVTQTPLSEEDWYWVALHEIGHVLGIGTSDRWFAGLETIWHNDSVSVNPSLDSLCTKFGRNCDWETGHNFFTDSAVVDAISGMTAAYEGLLIPIPLGFGEAHPAHWPTCVRYHAYGSFATASHDIMVRGGGLQHPHYRAPSSLPEITLATLTALRGFKYDDTWSGAGRYTEPTWLNRTFVREAHAGLSDGTTYAYEYEGTDCPTPVKRDRTAWRAGADAAPRHSRRPPSRRGPADHPVILTDYLWRPDGSRP